MMRWRSIGYVVLVTVLWESIPAWSNTAGDACNRNYLISNNGTSGCISSLYFINITDATTQWIGSTRVICNGTGLAEINGTLYGAGKYLNTTGENAIFIVNTTNGAATLLSPWFSDGFCNGTILSLTPTLNGTVWGLFSSTVTSPGMPCISEFNPRTMTITFKGSATPTWDVIPGPSIGPGGALVFDGTDSVVYIGWNVNQPYVRFFIQSDAKTPFVCLNGNCGGANSGPCPGGSLVALSLHVPDDPIFYGLYQCADGTGSSWLVTIDHLSNVLTSLPLSNVAYAYGLSLYGDPCLNGGNCQVVNNGPKVCICQAGYQGSVCQTDINECASNPCQNGASCVDNVNSYTCNCVDGFSGAQCQTDIDECVSTPCQNGGICSDFVNGFVCECNIYFIGDLCQYQNTPATECQYTSLAFNGPTDNLRLNISNPRIDVFGESISIFLWAYPTAVTTGITPFIVLGSVGFAGTSQNSLITFGFNDGMLYASFDSYQDMLVQSTDNTIQSNDVNSWHTYGFVFNSRKKYAQLYRDNVVVGSSVMGGLSYTILTAIQIGGVAMNMVDVSIYKRALSIDELTLAQQLRIYSGDSQIVYASLNSSVVVNQSPLVNPSDNNIFTASGSPVVTGPIPNAALCPLCQCPSGFTCCSVGSCFDLNNDPNHCGGCNSPCGSGCSCSGATCQCA